MAMVKSDFYCDCCGTRIEGVTFFNVILAVVYHYDEVCFEKEITPTLDRSPTTESEVIHLRP